MKSKVFAYTFLWLIGFYCLGAGSAVFAEETVKKSTMNFSAGNKETAAAAAQPEKQPEAEADQEKMPEETKEPAKKEEEAAKKKEEPEAEAEPVSKKEEIKEIKEKTTEAKKELKQKEGEITTAKVEAGRIEREKLELEKEAKLKEQEALVAKQEAEALKKVAQTQGDHEASKQALEIEKQARELKKEAQVHKEQLTVVESKAQLAQEKVVANEQIVEKLHSEIDVLKKAKISKLSFGHKFTTTSFIITVGFMLLVFLNLAVRSMRGLLSRKSQKLLAKGVLRESESALRTKTLANLFGWVGYIVVILVTIYLVLSNLGYDVAPLLAGAGILGLAFGFGGQYLIRDIITGIFLLIEGQIRIHDVVRIGDHGGLVEDINLRITTLRDLEGRVIVIPNGEIKTLVNYTKEFAYALLNIGVAYKENVDTVIEVLKKVGKEMREDTYFGRLILEDLEMLGVDDFGDSQVTIKFRIKTLPIKQWEVAREYRRRIKNRFDELGIEIPFPHRTFYMGTGKDNEWLKAAAGLRPDDGPVGSGKKTGK